MNAQLLFHVSFLALAITTTSLNAMLPLSRIERMLVAKEIRRKGINAVRQEIDQSKESKLTVNNNGRFGIRVPIVLHIEAIIPKTDRTKDPLAKAVFEEIEIVEKESGYIPTHRTTTTDNDVTVTMRTNYLGPDTYYYWLKDMVRVEARLTNKPELKSIIDNWNDTHN